MFQSNKERMDIMWKYVKDNIDTIYLAYLSKGKNYNLGIQNSITKDFGVKPTSTLCCNVIERLEKNDYISFVSEMGGKGKHRKIYEIKPKGSEFLKNSMDILNSSIAITNRIAKTS